MAKDEGITTAEVEAVKHCVMAVAAGQVGAKVAAARAAARDPGGLDRGAMGDGPGS